MNVHNDPNPWQVRALLKATATPFTMGHYEPRAAIFRQGDACDSLMHIETGRVWLAVTARSGKEVICGLLDSGTFLGEEALTGCGERPHSAVAMTATEVLVVAKADMTRLLRTKPELLGPFVAHLIARNIRLETDLTDQLLYASEQRLAHVLLALANCDKRCPGQCTLPDLPQELIAEMVGTTRSRVNLFMNKFKKLGFIEDDGRVLHINATRLHVVDEGDRHDSLTAQW